ncbi:PspC domain-containing protein [Flexivirga sp. ID2601S]|uniref:PspC domain-containing protein n=1 Tax=Flexivirga aerilata TaxID=1656889 RepID=A0A849AJ77_9MICO|nr:ATP-binding protein [Flexivirga aerilata]NNG40043.1 PspC domain-containing protein [Flexivirga aerilata]
MSEATGTPERARAGRPPLARPTTGRMVAGVCAGVSTHLGVPLQSLRVLTALSGLFLFGLPVYVFLWLTMPETDKPPLISPFEKSQQRVPKRRLILIGLPVLVVGALAVTGGVRSAGRLSLTLPLLVIAAGLVLVWSRLDRSERRQWLSAEDRRETRIRTMIGVALAAFGLILLLSQGGGLTRLRDVAIAVLVVLVGAAILGAPFIARLFDSLRQEQAERIRATEKADIAAHLHDSVLQTLALIQRRADDPQAVQLLARAQERELRGWLYADDRSADSTLAAAVAAAAHDIETLHGTPIDLVVTGDRTLDESGGALVRALREALANAVRHGAPPVSVYLEVGPRQVEAFVRDHGSGFALDEVPDDRLGVRESIIGRMRRHGGEAEVRRRDDGTEVRLRLIGTPDTATQHEEKEG